LALIVMDLLGRKRFWPAGLGVLVAAWSRQPCYLYALPVLWLAFRSPRPANALLRAGIPIAIAGIVTGGLNYAKFGSPFESGYRYLFAEVDLPKDDPLRGPTGNIEIVSLRYLPHHAYDMFISPPDAYMTGNGPVITGAGPQTALWYGTPLFALTLLGIHRWWPDRTKRTLMLSTLPVMFVALIWHGPVEGCPGYYRYTLDFGLIWLAVIAAWTEQPRMRVISLVCLAWGVFYFYMLGRT